LALLALVIGPIVVVVALTVESSADGSSDTRAGSDLPSTDINIDLDLQPPPGGLDAFSLAADSAAASDAAPSGQSVSGVPEPVRPGRDTTGAATTNPNTIDLTTEPPTPIPSPASRILPVPRPTLIIPPPAPASSTSTTLPSAVASSTLPAPAPTAVSTTTPAAETSIEPSPAATAGAPQIDVGLIGASSVRYRLTFDTSTSFVVTVRDGAEVVDRGAGAADAGEPVRLTTSGLSAGRTYTIEASSAAGAVGTTVVRTAGSPATAEPSAEQIEIRDLRLVDVGPTRFELRYETNICGNGSFVIRDDEGRAVGRNAGQSAGCTTSHAAIPGFWTAALDPDTTYTITLTAEADGAGLGQGNEASASLSVSTSAL